MPCTLPAASSPRTFMQPISPYRQVADAVARTCCFVAVLGLPLYFSLLTTTGFEPDKAVLVRALAVLAGAAWLTGEVVQPRGIAWRAVPPLLWAGLAVFAAMAIATLLSIDPRLSFWGSAARQEGLTTWLAYLVFLLVAATRLRAPGDWRRLISSLLLGSVPVVTYGCLQQLGLDPVPANGDPTTLAWPVRSTLGQHVFLGSYLVMVIPFALARFLEGTDRSEILVPDTGARPVLIAAGSIAGMLAIFFGFVITAVAHPALFALFPGILAAYAGLVILFDRLPRTRTLDSLTHWGYGALTVLLIVTLTISGARGAWLGALAMLPVFGFLAARRQGRTRISRTILGVSALAAVFLILLNIPGGPLQPLRTIHGLSRVANITESGGAEGSAQGRLLLWQGVGRLMTSTPSIGAQWGGPGRDVVGYGPESLHWAFQAVFPLELRRVTSEIWTWDRSHDIYLDLFVDAGLLGLLSFLAVLAMLFRQVLASLRAADDRRAWILIPIASALAGHLVDGIFSLETPVTLILIWLFVGLLSQPLPATEIVEAPVQLPGSVVRQYGLLWLALGIAAVILAFLPSDTSPTLLVAVWVVSLVAGVRSVTSLLGIQVSGRARLRLSRTTLATLVILLAALGGLYSQMRYDGAAIADRAGLTALGHTDLPAAIADLQFASAESPFEPQYRTELAGAYLTLGAVHLDSADPAYVPSPGDITTIDPVRANGFSQTQLFDLAAYTLKSVRDLSPLDPDTYGNLGDLYLAWGRPQQAAPYFREAEALSRKNPRYIDEEAQVDLRTGKIRAAQGAATRAFGLDDTFWYTYYTMALVDHRLGNHAGTRQAAALALTWVKNYWPAPPQSQIQQLQTLQQAG